MKEKTKKARGWALVVIVATLCLLAPREQARAQDSQHTDQQGSQANGPTTQPGETVLVPKKKDSSTVPEIKQPEKINPKDVFTLSTSTNLVNVDVLVTDQSGNPIPSLNKSNFKVYDDGVEQTLTNFGTGNVPTTTCLLIEFSNRSFSHLYLALEYAYQFLGAMQPKDWVAVVEYDMHPHILADFTQDRASVRAALDTLRIPGFEEANFFDALAFTMDRMRDIQGRKAIIAIVGGGSENPYNISPRGIDTFSKLTYPQMLKVAKASDTPVYAISTLEWVDTRNPYGSGITYEEAKNELNYICQYSGGQAYFPRFEAELPSVYQQISGQLRTEYGLGFVPSNPAKDGRYHKLKVELVDAQGGKLRIVNQKGKQVKYRVAARDGYYAPKS